MPKTLFVLCSKNRVLLHPDDNQRCGLCNQGRLRSVWASAESESLQSVRRAMLRSDRSNGQQNSVPTVRLPRLISVFSFVVQNLHVKIYG